MTRRIWTMAIAALCLAAGAGALAAVSGEPSPLLARSRPSVVDSHAAKGHSKLKCGRCHPRAATSGWASDQLLPAMAMCVDCHPEAEGATVFTAPTQSCSKCHLKSARADVIVRGDYPRPNIRFSHKAHKSTACSRCHEAAGSNRARKDGRDVVGMKTCYACHEGKGKGLQQCRTCHLVHQDGRMITSFGDAILTPPTWLKGPNHGADWVGTHAPMAGADSGFCGSCHRESECQDCHTGRLRAKNVHPGDWIAAHGVSTRMDNPRCTGCHRSQSFCITCHRRSGVAPDSPTGVRPPGSGSFHKGTDPAKICRRARRDITACVSCHSESSCIRCHGTINPHPPGFSRRCKPLARKNQKACVKCHDSNAIWLRCQ